MSSVDDSIGYSLDLFNDNIFFCEGIKNILAKQKCENYIFIQFETFLLKKVSSDDLSIYSGVRFILISDIIMMPLALYLMNTCENIEAVFEKKTRISRILQAMNNHVEKRRAVKEIRNKYHALTSREFDFLKAFVNEKGTVFYLATTLGVSEKMIYNYRRSIAKKMGVKKIEFLMYLLVAP